MTTYIKEKLKKSYDYMNNDKYRVAACTEYYIVLKLIFRRIIIAKFIMMRQLFHVKNERKMSKINMFKIEVRTFWSELYQESSDRF